jgi:membrane protease YdiL (CAAX protease family)
MVWCWLCIYASEHPKLVNAQRSLRQLIFFGGGFGEELLFRGFLQTRCTAWLGSTKGLFSASLIMAFAHIPQRIFVQGMNPTEALFSCVLLLPVS